LDVPFDGLLLDMENFCDLAVLYGMIFAMKMVNSTFGGQFYFYYFYFYR